MRRLILIATVLLATSAGAQVPHVPQVSVLDYLQGKDAHGRRVILNTPKGVIRFEYPADPAVKLPSGVAIGNGPVLPLLNEMHEANKAIFEHMHKKIAGATVQPKFWPSPNDGSDCIAWPASCGVVGHTQTLRQVDDLYNQMEIQARELERMRQIAACNSQCDTELMWATLACMGVGLAAGEEWTLICTATAFAMNTACKNYCSSPY